MVVRINRLWSVLLGAALRRAASIRCLSATKAGVPKYVRWNRNDGKRRLYTSSLVNKLPVNFLKRTCAYCIFNRLIRKIRPGVPRGDIN
jgi:hypothetical protein